MSFDDLLTIFFLLVFVVAPLFSRLSGGGGRRQQPPRTPRQSPPVSPPADGRPDEAGTTAGSDEGFLDRLEEARRRVREAMGESEELPERRAEAASERATGRASGQERASPAADVPARGRRTAGTPASGPTSSSLDWQPSPGTLDWQPAPTAYAPFLAREGSGASTSGVLGATLAGASATDSDMRRKRRPSLRRSARMGPVRLPGLDRNSILNGMVWHEILSEPPSKRRTRRAKSRLRSR